MSAVTVLGALLVIAGLVLIASAAIRRGRLSDPHHHSSDTARRTLEPRQRGVGFLGPGVSRPGLLLVVAGAVLLLSPLVL